MKNFILLLAIIINFAFAQQLSNKQLDMLKKEFQQLDSSEVNQASEVSSLKPFKTIELNKSNVKPNDLLFGYNYFNQDLKFYDNIPTPKDYQLGPGDEIEIFMWGEANLKRKFLIDRQGAIFFENIGFINISNNTIPQAEELLQKKLSKIYSTLSEENKTTELSIELREVKSLNIFFSGQVNNPGISLIHPFSDIFTALVQNGGVSKNGSLRNIQLIRNNKIISEIDFYNFFNDGKNDFSNIKIIDGDVIHVPTVNKRVKIENSIKVPGFYEMVDGEFLTDLIRHASGLSSSAASFIILKSVNPIDSRVSDDFAISGYIIEDENYNSTLLNDGDIVKVPAIQENVTDLTIYGNVKNPGNYPANGNSLKMILDIAGGFNDPIFNKSIDNSISVLRKDENQFYANEIIVKYKDSSNFIMEEGDKVFVYENVNYRNSFTFQVKGEVNRPGTYPLTDRLTLSDAIALAGGVTEMGSINSVSVIKNLERINDDGIRINESELVSNISLDFEIGNENVVTILPKTNVVRINGNVYNPGLIGHQSGAGLTMAKAIELAGGYKPNSMKKRSYVVRANGKIEKVSIFRGTAKRVFPGDSIFVPVNPEPTNFEITTFISDLASTLANIAAILVIVDNNN
jgi:protein involved in polysaccharide export with SLBB domain